jgi:predicted nucleic acid-binding protein
MSIVPARQVYIDFASPYSQLPTDNFYFLDTSFLIAISDASDRFHRKAVPFWDRLVDVGAGLVVNGIVIGEFVHVYMRILYRQKRLSEIIEQTSKAKGTLPEIQKAYETADVDKEWDNILTHRPEMTAPFFVHVRSKLEPLLRDRVLEVAEDGRSTILEAFELKSLFHLGSNDANIVASAKNLGSVLVTTDHRLINGLSAGAGPLIVIYSTLPT